MWEVKGQGVQGGNVRVSGFGFRVRVRVNKGFARSDSRHGTGNLNATGLHSYGKPVETLNPRNLLRNPKNPQPRKPPKP